MAKVIQFLVYPGRNYISFANCRCRLFHEGGFNSIDKRKAILKLGYKRVQGRLLLADFLYWDDAGQAPAQLLDFARSNLSGRCTGYDALQVSQIADSFTDIVQGEFVMDKSIHGIVSTVKFLYIKHRKGEPVPEQTRSHGAAAMVHNVQQAYTLGLENFQVAHGELVHPDKAAFVYAGQGTNVAQTGMMSLFKINHQRTGGTDAKRIRINGIALKAVYL